MNKIAISICIVLLTSCSSSTTVGDADSGTDVVTDGDAAADVVPDVPPDGEVPCACTPGIHNDRIVVLSDDAELWTYDPATDTFEFLAALMCGGLSYTYSMAVDEKGVAWILNADSFRIVNVDVNDPSECEDSGYMPRGSFELFGMAFTNESFAVPCPSLYVHTYSGSGPFREGEDIGTLAVMDPDTLTLSEVGSIDFDGGELTGTRDGRLFAFAGVDPAKLVEYDKSDARVIELIPLEGLSKTTASAFAFFAGDFYFFTEAMPSGCIPCLESSCLSEYEACMADTDCAAEFQCAIDQQEMTDECGGGMTTEFQTCVNGTCYSECFPTSVHRVSKVTHMDYDESGGAGRALTVVNPEGPTRVVGAGTSPCVPEVPF
jgi:hypothetical protein